MHAQLRIVWVKSIFRSLRVKSTEAPRVTHVMPFDMTNITHFNNLIYTRFCYVHFLFFPIVVFNPSTGFFYSRRSSNHLFYHHHLYIALPIIIHTFISMIKSLFC